MPGFCTQCGSPLSGSFCGKCGKAAGEIAGGPAQAAPVPSVPPQPAALPVAPMTKGPSVAKILLIAGGLVLLLIVLLVGFAVFTVVSIKHKVQEATGGAMGSTSQMNLSHGNSCRLLGPEQVQAVLEVEIVRAQEMTEGADSGCAYYTNAEGFAKLQKIATEQAKRDSEAASKAIGPNNNNPLELMKHTKEMEGMIKALAMTQPDADGRVFAFTIQKHFDKENWASMRTAMALVPGFEEVPDVGDHAMLGAFGHTFLILKGNNLIHMETMYVPEARTRAAQLGQQLLANQ